MPVSKRLRVEPVPRRVTLRDVAAVAGVDPSAVSRVVNNDPRVSVSAATRQRILDTVEQLGYRPSFGARQLRSSKTWTIGFVLPSLSNPLYEPIVQGVERAAARHGYALVLGSHAEGGSASSFVSLLQEGRVDGLLVASGTLHDGLLRSIVDHGPGPVVLVNRRIEGVQSCVVVDDEGASSAAVSYLASLGHRHVVGIFGPAEIDTSVRRRRGFVTEAEAIGLHYVVVERPGLTIEDGYRAAVEVLSTSGEVTALYASTLLMAVGALRAASETGRAVPGQLSVLGLHDAALAQYVVPPLSVVRLPTRELGERAVELLIERAGGGPERSVLIPGHEIVARRSTAPIVSS